MLIHLHAYLMAQEVKLFKYSADAVHATHQISHLLWTPDMPVHRAKTVTIKL